ncbi:GSCOCG00008712001-RA-CDS [Cotesia congregata]|uniref:Similar to 63 kDa sperm flagellar membrane protein (Strongylocentrotus purpuratus) n=1 Tax=Cotesia congregata TaxID=51543 RepID=A0A8J2MMN9_COTCN|nr:GSCOCG00008712001-RA-CDS [Cotesia congregata]CAG5096469.1 Similar to 63 kDa sperm flagellar membrane protein (Strongylocentrotus purpuratus) [Cotesia congregata]
MGGLCIRTLKNRQTVVGSMSVIFVIFLVCFKNLAVGAIQNTPTYLVSSEDHVVLSASSFNHDKTYSGPEKESEDELASNYKTIQSTVQHKNSKNVENFKPGIEDVSVKERNHDIGWNTVITASKYVNDIDGNNIEVKPAEYFDIKPTKEFHLSGEGKGAPQRQAAMSEPHQLTGLIQQRQSRQEVPRIYSNRTILGMQTASIGSRQANPDIQDIITGIVKLLNGNVNVAANTIRPHKPVQATRINNRGPPRISDLPPLPPDFDTPGMNPPPPPDYPYPFEKPPPLERPSINQLPPIQERPTPQRPYVNIISTPEPIGPQNNKLWNRPFQRPVNNQRPNTSYKPLISDEEYYYGNENNKDISKPTNTSTNKPINDKQVPTSETVTEETITTKKPPKYQPPLEQNKKVADNTLILGSNLQPIPIFTQSESPANSVIALDSSGSSTKPTKSFSQEITESKSLESSTGSQLDITRTTLKIETSSSIQVIEPTRTVIEVQPSIVPLEKNSENINSMISTLSETKTFIEPSTVSTDSTYSNNNQFSTPTEGLSTILSTTKTNNIVKTMNRNSNSMSTKPFHQSSATSNNYRYRPRPGIVLDDTLDYTKSPGLATQRPHPPPRHPPIGDIFDITVSAVQGPSGGSGESVRVSVNPTGGTEVILTSAVDGQGFVSIDGKRTYLNLFDNSDENTPATKVQIHPTRSQIPAVTGTGYAEPQIESTLVSARPSGPIKRPIFRHRTTQPPVRIDTCIVGETSTCDASQNEACATVQGVSACHCKPGFARHSHSLLCKKVVSIVVSIRVDRIYDWKIIWSPDFADKESEIYQTIAFETNKAIESAMSMTPFSDEYMDSSINNLFQGLASEGRGGVFVNATLKLTYEPRTARPALAGDLQKHLLGVLNRRNNNIGNSAVYVESASGAISSLQDLDECASSELNDCNASAVCTNNWGGFTCSCKPGFKDPHKDDPNKVGRSCLSCPSSHCNNRGTCSYQDNVRQCSCTGNYYGTQCEIDGEVLGVSIGATVGAIIVIILTIVGLFMWSRGLSRDQKPMGSPVYGYMQNGIPGTLPGTLARVGSVGTLASVKQGPPPNLPPYLWGHITERMATANLYATEPLGPTRPSSAVFGYPTLSCHGTLPPVPLPRLQAPPRPRQRYQPDPDSSDSEPQDKDRADLIPSNGFHVPRPKSRSSLANQSGIYYDVEYDQGDAHHLSKNNIPMSTYSMARPYYRT